MKIGEKGAVVLVEHDGEDYMRLALPKFFAKFGKFGWYRNDTDGWTGVSMPQDAELEEIYQSEKDHG